MSPIKVVLIDGSLRIANRSSFASTEGLRLSLDLEVEGVKVSSATNALPVIKAGDVGDAIMPVASIFNTDSYSVVKSTIGNGLTLNIKEDALPCCRRILRSLEAYLTVKVFATKGSPWMVINYEIGCVACTKEAEPTHMIVQYQFPLAVDVPMQPFQIPPGVGRGSVGDTNLSICCRRNTMTPFDTDSLQVVVGHRQR